MRAALLAACAVSLPATALADYECRFKVECVVFSPSASGGRCGAPQGNYTQFFHEGRLDRVQSYHSGTKRIWTTRSQGKTTIHRIYPDTGAADSLTVERDGRALWARHDFNDGRPFGTLSLGTCRKTR